MRVFHHKIRCHPCHNSKTRHRQPPRDENSCSYFIRGKCQIQKKSLSNLLIFLCCFQIVSSMLLLLLQTFTPRPGQQAGSRRRGQVRGAAEPQRISPCARDTAAATKSEMLKHLVPKKWRRQRRVEYGDLWGRGGVKVQNCILVLRQLRTRSLNSVWVGGLSFLLLLLDFFFFNLRNTLFS